MQTLSNVYSQGGGGTSYEFEVQTAFMAYFLAGGIVPGLFDSQIQTIRFQSSSLGYRTDDLYLECFNSHGTRQRVLLQVKHEMPFTERNDIFAKTLKGAWADFNNTTLFDQQTDRIYFIKSRLSTDEKKHFKTLCDWAKYKTSHTDFIREAYLIKAKWAYVESFKKIITSTSYEQPSDEQLYAFFRCLDVLSFDFGDESSTSKAAMLTLISYAKHASCELSGMQVWDSIFSFVGSADNKGAYFDSQHKPPALSAFFEKKQVTLLQKSLQTLSLQGVEIIDAMASDIGGITLPRSHYIESLTGAVASEQFTIITGAPGAGKSVLSKQFLSVVSRTGSGYFLILKADELNNIQLRDYFLKHHIQLSLAEVFSLFPLHGQHYIYIDSLEKMLEGDSEAFRQLLKVLGSNKHIKLLASCREANLSLISIKFFTALRPFIFKMGPLQDDELSVIGRQLPELPGLLNNKRLQSLLYVPKYLDFALRAVRQLTEEAVADMNEAEFVQSLWDIIVENKINENTEGIPQRRGKQFLEIAVTRASSMSPYIIPKTPDLPAIAKLEHDGVINRSVNGQAYAPAHDILEDWALVRHVEALFCAYSSLSAFFEALGKEPAMRRAFRLWAIQVLKAKEPAKLTFFSATLDLDKQYWREEAIVALLLSDYLPAFLQQHERRLIAGDWGLLTKLLHLMRVACREYKQPSPWEEENFISSGECWGHMIGFIDDHLSALPVAHNDLVLSMLVDWHYLIPAGNIPITTQQQAWRIAHHLLFSRYIKTEYYYYHKERFLQCIRILLDCCDAMPIETTELVTEALLEYEMDAIDDGMRERRHLREAVIDTITSGIYATQVARNLPTLLIKILRKEWIYEEPEVKDDKDKWGFTTAGRRDDANTAFGLTSEYKCDYFPASAYQTPVYWLLQYHTSETVNFIICLLNYASRYYMGVDYASQDEKTTINLFLPDCSNVSQDGSRGLWCMFRGTGISTPYLLQSVLMALEKFLLELAAQGSNTREKLQSVIETLYRDSTTVSITAVLSSVAQAYPLMVGKWVLPLLSDRKLLTWDVSRYGEDQGTPAFAALPSDVVYQRERIASNHLTHRLKNYPGLKGFIVDYCFNVREYNREIFAILDEHKRTSSEDDWEWKMILADIDIRNWKMTASREVEGTLELQLEPVHEGRLKEEIDKLKDGADDYLLHTGQRAWLRNVKEQKEPPDIHKWLEIVGYYKAQTTINPQYHHPGLAAALGIRFLWADLPLAEKQWCFDTVLSIAQRVIDKEHRYDFLTFDTSPFDMQEAMAAVPLFLGADAVEEQTFILVIAGILFENIGFNNTYYEKFLHSCSQHIWYASPGWVEQLFLATLSFAKTDLNNPFHSHRPVDDKQAEAYLSQVKAIQDSLSQRSVRVDIGSVSFETHSPWVLLKAVKILPVKDAPTICYVFLQKMVVLLTAQLLENEDSSSPESSVYYEQQTILEEKVGQVIFWNPGLQSETLFRCVIDMLYYAAGSDGDKEGKREAIKFLRGCIKNIILTADRNLPANDEATTKNTCCLFEVAWDTYARILTEKKAIISGDLLLLNISWRADVSNWLPLDNMVPFFKKAIVDIGTYYPAAVINLLSHIGDKTLLPEGFHCLWISLQQSGKQLNLLSFNGIEQLMYRVYNHHTEALIANKTILEGFIEVLDLLVSEGSSHAYWIREYLVSFKH